MPGSRLFFPSWNTTTAELAPMAQPPPDPDRAAKMPNGDAPALPPSPHASKPNAH